LLYQDISRLFTVASRLKQTMQTDELWSSNPGYKILQCISNNLNKVPILQRWPHWSISVCPYKAE